MNIKEKERVLVFTACYNEKQNIEKLILEIKNNLPNCNILIIDDNSPDQTQDVVKTLQNKISNLKLVVREKKLGLDTAHKLAYEYAIKNNVDFLITMDADLSHDPRELKNFVTYLRQYPLQYSRLPLLMDCHQKLSHECLVSSQRQLSYSLKLLQ